MRLSEKEGRRESCVVAMEKHSLTPEYDYYRILGVNPNASHADIRRAFRTLALRYHPDQNPDDSQAGEKFKIITEAYKVLINPKTRRSYDRVRNSSRVRHRPGRPAPGNDADTEWPDSPFRQPRGATAPTPSPDATEEKSTRKPWWAEEQELPKAQPAPPPPPPPQSETMEGSDIEADMTITEEVASFGSKQPLAVSRFESCPTCNGTGGKPGTALRRCPECDPQHPSPACHLCAGRGHMIEVACPSCFGRGKHRVTKTLVINLPRRSQTGQRIRIPGEGMPGRGEGKPGDLVVRLVVKGRDEYEPRDPSVYSEIHITPQIATKGGVVRVKTLDGSVELVIPPGTKSDAVFRLEGRGAILQGKERGDHFVTVKIVAP